MIILVAVLALAIYIGLLVNTGRMIYIWVKPIFQSMNSLVYGIIYALIAFAIIVAFIVSRIPGIGIPRIVFRIAHYALGFLVYLMMFVNVTALLLFIGRLVRIVPTPLPNAVALTAVTVCTAIVVGLSSYGIIHAASIQTTVYTVELEEPQAEMDSLRIALLSDSHLGYYIEEAHLEKIVTAVNKVEADIVCIAGDIFDGDITSLSGSAKLQELLQSINSKYGVYACLGNHDAGASYEQMLEFLSDADVQVLEDESVVIDNRILLVGRKDSSPIGGQGAPREELMTVSEDNQLPVIVMDHQPGNIGEYGTDVDLIICGHTHRGQMFPFNLITRAIFEVDYGYYRAPDGAPQVIVSSGAGTWGPPQRVGTDNEIVEIEVLFSKADDEN